MRSFPELEGFFALKELYFAVQFAMTNQLNLTKSHKLGSDSELRTAFAQFLEQPFSYRKQFLQSHYATAFDGYSYMGQEDSTNQYGFDKLHSFVLSAFNPVHDFPTEFHNFLNTALNPLLEQIKELEINLIRKLNIPDLECFYQNNIGHMISCNYYPKTAELNSYQDANLRLSSHKDVSLFTTFPYGVAHGFSYNNHQGQKEILESTGRTISFAGYFLEWLTNQKYAALAHQVEMPKNHNSERYSFVVFSIPKPNATFELNAKPYTAEDYYQHYLSLF